MIEYEVWRMITASAKGPGGYERRYTGTDIEAARKAFQWAKHVSLTRAVTLVQMPQHHVLEQWRVVDGQVYSIVNPPPKP